MHENFVESTCYVFRETNDVRNFSKIGVFRVANFLSKTRTLVALSTAEAPS